MQRQRTWKEYRLIDLALFAVFTAVFEFIIVTAANWWFPDQLFIVSLAAALTAIVYMRWGAWGAIHAVEAGFIFCLFSGATRSQYIIYCVGNLLSLAAVPLLQAVGKERARQGGFALIFPLLVLLLMQAGRAIVAIILGAAPSAAVEFFTTDSLSYIFTFVIIWVAKRLDGVYEDQKHYLLRIQEQEE
ncbi:MAG: hypothetical protein J1E43_12750 [Christensenellaceae bacterium]|nr:hypothetical protein [Christensenellaceae bacterium]